MADLKKIRTDVAASLPRSASRKGVWSLCATNLTVVAAVVAVL
jgi:hypothetical protein